MPLLLCQVGIFSFHLFRRRRRRRRPRWIPIQSSTKSLIDRYRDSGVAAIESLMNKRGAFDYILLETTGLADPGNIAPLFWVDQGLGSTIYLDGIVTVVDAKNLFQTLNDGQRRRRQPGGSGSISSAITTAHLQISHADIIIVNKSDAVPTQTALNKVVNRVQAINGLAKIHTTHYARVPRLEGFLLDLHAYDEDDKALRALNDMSRQKSSLDPVRMTILFFFFSSCFVLWGLCCWLSRGRD